MEQYYLELCNDPIRFDPISQINEVFFDDSNKQVCIFMNGVRYAFHIPTDSRLFFLFLLHFWFD